MIFIPIHFPAFRSRKLRAVSAFQIKIRYIHPIVIVFAQSNYQIVTDDKMLLLLVYGEKLIGIITVIREDLSRFGLVKVELVRILIQQAVTKLGINIFFAR